jgi:hypothetical protein
MRVLPASNLVHQNKSPHTIPSQNHQFDALPPSPTQPSTGRARPRPRLHITLDGALAAAHLISFAASASAAVELAELAITGRSLARQSPWTPARSCASPWTSSSSSSPPCRAPAPAPGCTLPTRPASARSPSRTTPPRSPAPRCSRSRPPRAPPRRTPTPSCSASTPTPCGGSRRAPPPSWSCPCTRARRGPPAAWAPPARWAGCASPSTWRAPRPGRPSSPGTAGLTWGSPRRVRRRPPAPPPARRSTWSCGRSPTRGTCSSSAASRSAGPSCTRCPEEPPAEGSASRSSPAGSAPAGGQPGAGWYLAWRAVYLTHISVCPLQRFHQFACSFSYPCPRAVSILFGRPSSFGSESDFITTSKCLCSS